MKNTHYGSQWDIWFFAKFTESDFKGKQAELGVPHSEIQVELD